MKQSTKIAKPSKDFPLTPHPSGRWCKKVLGVVRYFGKIDDPQAALEEWLRVKDYLLAGRTPPANIDGLTVMDLCNHFMTSRQHKMEAGELKQKTWTDYDSCCRRLLAVFGKTRVVTSLDARDFAALRAHLADIRGPVALANEIQRVRSVFKFGYDAGLLDRPIRYGPDFKKPSRRTIRLARAARPARFFTAEQCRQLLKIASPKLRAMIYLALNAGFGNTDVSSLPIGAVDLAAGFIDFVRPKTGTNRRTPLWPETIAAFQEVLAQRKEPKDMADAGLTFITKHGTRYVRGKSTDGVGLQFRKLLDQLGLRVAGRNFYALRHVHRTIADEVKDRPAADLIMGHQDGDDIVTAYRESISDDRLRAITNHVRSWLEPWKTDEEPVQQQEEAQ
jgi:integrase